MSICFIQNSCFLGSILEWCYFVLGSFHIERMSLKSVLQQPNAMQQETKEHESLITSYCDGTTPLN
jgi:hypothetical protein